MRSDHQPSTRPSAARRLLWRSAAAALVAATCLSITAAASPLDAGGSVQRDIVRLDSRAPLTVKAAVYAVALSSPPVSDLDPAGFELAIDEAARYAEDAARYDAAVQAAAEAQAAEEAARATQRFGGGPSEAGLAALRACESSGNYGAVSSTGAYRGAYQFSQQTWNSIASRYHPWLVGVDPAAAAPADQDAQARALYVTSGRGQWPHCGSRLG